MRLAVDPHEDFIEVESVPVASMFSFQSYGVQRAELDTLKADRFAAHDNSPLG